MVLLHCLSTFSNRSIKNWNLQIIMKCCLPDKNTQKFSACISQNCKFLEKLSPLVHFVYSFSIAWIFGIINQVIQKAQSLQISICSQLQAKHLMITQEKNDGVKIVLSYGLQQNVSVELHIIKCWSNILCNWARLSQQPANLMFLTSTLLMGVPATTITQLWVLGFGFVCSLHGGDYGRAKEHARSQRC